MRPGAAGRRGRKPGKGSRWGALVLGAFLAGLFLVLAIFLRSSPEGEKAPTPPAPRRPAARPAARPPAGKLAIVVDDLGYDPRGDAGWLGIAEPLTLAVIPFGPSSRSIAEAARARGWGVIVHVPMEPEGDAGDRTLAFRLGKAMSPGAMEAALDRMLADLPQAVGISNHMGSAFTSDPEAVSILSSILEEKGLCLLDSLTSPRSVLYAAGRRAGLAVARRDVFLDGLPEPDAMRREWDRALAIARSRGAAVLLCHSRPGTLRAVRALLPGLRREGIRPVALAEVLDRRGSP